MESPVAWARHNGSRGRSNTVGRAGYANLAWSIAHIINQPWDDHPTNVQDLICLLEPSPAIPAHIIRAARTSKHLLFPCNLTNTTWNDQREQIAQHRWITTTPTRPHDLRECVIDEAHAYTIAAHIYGVDLFRIPAADRPMFRLTTSPSGHLLPSITSKQLAEITGWTLTETEQICHRR